ncbi:MAG: IS701 family transposase [Chloroflexi bacterium]|nr:IS701 family transposase [Chloroflexota bacterium]
MTSNDLSAWATEFEAFHARFARFFKRSEPRQQSAKYLRALMAPVQRKNGWQLAEAVGDRDPQRMERLLYEAHWDRAAVGDELQCFVIERFGDGDGIGVLDETGFIKKGDNSVGVMRQYSGTAGKIENCQVGVFLTYRTAKGHTFLDAHLYLPKEWCNDAERRKRAGVPDTVTFQSKPDLAIAMLKHAWANGVPMRWVVGDEIYGDAVKVRRTVEEARRLYVFAVSSTTRVWPQKPAVIMPFQPATGRPRTVVRLAADAAPSSTVRDVVAAWPAEAWHRLSVADGAKGPLTYDWACARVWDSRDGVPGVECWLLARRSINDPKEIAYYLSNAPAETPLETLAWAASQRWTIEQCLEEGKGETGLDEYEVRSWESWHRHIMLSMMAHAWLASLKAAQVFSPGGPGSC